MDSGRHEMPFYRDHQGADFQQNEVLEEICYPIKIIFPTSERLSYIDLIDNYGRAGPHDFEFTSSSTPSPETVSSTSSYYEESNSSDVAYISGETDNKNDSQFGQIQFQILNFDESLKELEPTSVIIKTPQSNKQEAKLKCSTENCYYEKSNSSDATHISSETHDSNDSQFRNTQRQILNFGGSLKELERTSVIVKTHLSDKQESTLKMSTKEYYDNVSKHFLKNAIEFSKDNEASSSLKKNEVEPKINYRLERQRKIKEDGPNIDQNFLDDFEKSPKDFSLPKSYGRHTPVGKSTSATTGDTPSYTDMDVPSVIDDENESLRQDTIDFDDEAVDEKILHEEKSEIPEDLPDLKNPQLQRKISRNKKRNWEPDVRRRVLRISTLQKMFGIGGDEDIYLACGGFGVKNPLDCNIPVPQFRNHEESFQCRYCFMIFKLRKSLMRHILCHTTYKRLYCVVCWKGFYDSYDLKRHSKAHSEIHPFYCKACQAIYTQKISLEDHIRNIHATS